MKVYSWVCQGSNSHGQLGQGLEFEQALKPQPTNIIQSIDVNSIVGGGKHTVIITKQGKAYACGDNDKGQLSKSLTTKLQLSFELINCKIKISKVSCGWDFTLALSTDGYVYGWGGNAYGQLGLSKGMVGSSYVITPVKVFDEAAIDVGAGLRHSLIVSRSGCVFATGSGRKGQLGVMIEDGKRNICQFTQVPTICDAEKVSCGESHSVASTKDSWIFTWGDNKFGQLGLDPELHFGCGVPTLVHQALGLKIIEALVSGWAHNAILTGDGRVFLWGRNDYGQLGLTTQKNWEANENKSLEGVKQIVLGSNHGVALTPNGDVLSWGWNEHGNCGTGNCVNVLEPTMVKTVECKVELIGTGSAHTFLCTQ